MENKTKFLVAITQRVDYISNRDELRESLDMRLVQLVLSAGYIPVATSNSLLNFEKKDNRQCGKRLPLDDLLSMVKPDAIVLSGGNDIGQYPERDETEKCLLDWAANHRMPVLGVCRGLQMMGVWAGGTLVHVTGHVRSRHNLVYQESASSWPESVNSYHNLALAGCPAGFQAIAHAEDGSIEAIRHVDLPWEGWMWHPEREIPFVDKDIKRLKALFGG